MGGFGYDNLGDDLILRSALDQLASLIPGAEFVVLSNNPYETSRRHPGYPVFFSAEALFRQVILRFVSVFARSYGKYVLPVHGDSFRGSFTSLVRADLVVSLGGGYLNDYSRYLTFFRLAELIVVGLLRKPLILLAHEIGPLKRLHLRALAKVAAAFVTYWTVRDRRSLDELSDLGIRDERSMLTADESWASEPRPSSSDESTKKVEVVIGVNLMPFQVISNVTSPLNPRPANADVMNQRLTSGFAEFLSSQGLGASRIICLCMSSNDTVLALGLKRLLSGKLGVDIVSDLDSQYDALRKCRVFVGMRLHAIIMAAQSGVPPIGLSIRPKVEDALHDLGLGRFIVQGLPLDTGRLGRLVHHAVLANQHERGELIGTMLAQVRVLKSRAERNALIVKVVAESIQKSGMPPSS